MDTQVSGAKLYLQRSLTATDSNLDPETVKALVEDRAGELVGTQSLQPAPSGTPEVQDPVRSQVSSEKRKGAVLEPV